MHKLILASSSARRNQILKDSGFSFISIPANLNEDKFLDLEPIKMVTTLSQLKAEKIAIKYPNSIILGADTTVILNKTNLGKPKSPSDAIRILKLLSGKEHLVITGFTIINPGNKTITSFDKSKIFFKNLTTKQIEDYVNNNQVLDKAGAYAIQEGAGEFVKKYEGDYLNIVGLPTKAINELNKILK